MGRRQLRHFYDDESVRLEVDAALGSVIEPWGRHRQRFLDEMSSLTEEQWLTASRCDGWRARDVICHLVDVDAFWVLSLTAGRASSPTTVLKNFDPTATPADLVDARAGMTTVEVAKQFTENTAALVEVVESMTEDEWSMAAESPLGHVPARLMLAHGLWDSWLHERDVLQPLGLTPPPDPVELETVTWYTLLFGAAQGGLLQDPRPVGAGATEPIDAQLRFDELTDPLHLTVDAGVFVGRGTDRATSVGSASELVEQLSGRLEWPTPDAHALPGDLAAHLERAREIL